MFGSKNIDNEDQRIARLPKGSQYALSVGIVYTSSVNIAKEINKHLSVHTNHKVIAVSGGMNKGGAIVIFEVQ